MVKSAKDKSVAPTTEVNFDINPEAEAVNNSSNSDEAEVNMPSRDDFTQNSPAEGQSMLDTQELEESGVVSDVSSECEYSSEYSIDTEHNHEQVLPVVSPETIVGSSSPTAESPVAPAPVPLASPINKAEVDSGLRSEFWQNSRALLSDNQLPIAGAALAAAAVRAGKLSFTGVAIAATNFAAAVTAFVTFSAVKVAQYFREKWKASSLEKFSPKADADGNVTLYKADEAEKLSFEHGVRAADSLQAQLSSYFTMETLKNPTAYAAGLAAKEAGNDAAITHMKSDLTLCLEGVSLEQASVNSEANKVTDKAKSKP